MVKEKVKQIVLHRIEKIFDLKLFDIELAAPPKIELGDFAIPCFRLASELQLSPNEIATKLAEGMKSDEIKKASAAGPYVNVKLRNEFLFNELIAEIFEKGANYLDQTRKSGKNIMVEFLSPNTNKPLHLGHVRNGALGMTTANILQTQGNHVIRANLVNNRGVHICKSMLAWKKWADGETPKDANMKGDHFVGKWYVKFHEELKKNPLLDDEAQKMLKKWEAGDKETIELWEMMNKWVYEGFAQSYDRFGFEFDEIYYESDTYKLGKDIIATGLDKGVFESDAKGNTVAILPEDKFGVEEDGSPKKITLLRSDGTSVYFTQDLGTAKMRFDKYGLDEMIYVVGSEQEYHFKALFYIFDKLGFKWAKNCFHLSYGMVYLPDGKMKSREGKIVDGDDLLEEVTQIAKEEIEKRNNDGDLNKDEIEYRSEIIALAAIKFYLLAITPKQDIHFDPKASLAFEGCTGPYCLYTYARASAILEKAKNGEVAKSDYSILGSPEELQLASLLVNFSDEVAAAAEEMMPSKLVTATFEIAKAFNQFYHKNPVLNAGNDALVSARIDLTRATMTVLKKGLNLLGIDVLEKM